MLLSDLEKPQATFDGNDIYNDLFSITASLMDFLIRNHPFVDGNKRTAITAALFMKFNCFSLVVSNEEMARFTLACDQSKVTLEEISAWLRQFFDRV